MEWLNQIVPMPFLCGMIFTIAGLIQYYFPPKNINQFYGYRTSASMSSKEKWDFAQKFSSVKLIQIGLILGLLSLTGFIVDFNDQANLIAGIVLALLSVLVLLISTENALKNKFPNT
ncbi:SdpI family protein [Flavobacterium sp.]|uniref:SdpI family protein n=1 Tax=Flavobacterium sp. TaxID=239 RepID=UPI003D6A7EB0